MGWCVKIGKHPKCERKTGSTLAEEKKGKGKGRKQTVTHFTHTKAKRAFVLPGNFSVTCECIPVL